MTVMPDNQALCSDIQERYARFVGEVRAYQATHPQPSARFDEEAVLKDLEEWAPVRAEVTGEF